MRNIHHRPAAAARRVAAMSALILVCAVPAAAQQEETGSWSLPGWSFTPGVSTGVVYDNNVSLSDASATTGRTPSDQLFLVQPFGRLEYNAARTVFSTAYRGFFRRYMELDQLNAFEQRADFSLRRLATRRVTFLFSNNFSDVPTTDDVELNGVPFSRTGTRTNALAGTVTGRLTQFTDLSVRYENTWVTFDQGPEVNTFLRGGYVNGVRADLSRRLNERVSAGGEYSFRFANLNEGTRKVAFQDFGGNVKYSVGRHTSASASAGISHLVDKEFDDTRTGPYIRLSIAHQMARATVGAAFDRSFVPSFGFGGSNRSQELTGYVAMPFQRNRLYLQASGSWRRSEPLIETSLELDTIRLRGTLGYSATRWLRGETFYTYSRQDSIVTGGEVDRHRLGLQLVISQPMRIR
jgi:hypothetical protein